MARSEKSYFLIIFLFFCGYVNTSAQSQEKYFIYFTDKNNSPFATDHPKTFLSPASIARRLKQNIPVTQKDLPVNSWYVDSLKKQGAEIVHVSKWFNAVLIKANTASLNTIVNNDFVINHDKLSRKDKVLTMPGAVQSGASNMDYGTSQNQMMMIGADRMHAYGYNGQGVTIAVFDAGFSNADNLFFFDSLFNNNQVIATYDFVNNHVSVYEDHEHGTQVLSLLAAYSDGNLIGTAYKAKYLLLRTEDVSVEDLTEEVNWLAAAEYADSAGADIINSSLAYRDFDDPSQDHTYADLDGNTTIITRAADFAASVGMLVVNSAGNLGNTSWKYIGAPADGDSVLTVGAVDPAGNHLLESSTGPASDNRIKPDLSAQGSQVKIGNHNGSFISGKGTSFSAPLVTGLAAGLWQAYPDLSNMEIIDYLKKSGNNYCAPDNKTGYGIPDFHRTLMFVTSFKDTNKDFYFCPEPGKDKPLVLHGSLRLVGHTYNIFIYDLAGRLAMENEFVFDGSSSIIELNIQDLSPGMYILFISGNNQTWEFKIVKS
jgi:serine protease AprX